MSQRQEQIESVLMRQIGGVLSRGLADPRIAGMVSVTRVSVSPDLRHADVFVSVMPGRYEKRTIAGLHSAAGRIAADVRKTIAARVMPRLRFKIDPTLKKQAEVFQAIREGMDKTARAPDLTSPSP
jgi:ribosome-binding factor A